jgi:hypothetical protein
MKNLIVKPNKKTILTSSLTNFAASHPRLVAIVTGVGISMLAVLVLTAIDGSLLGQQAEALRPIKEHEPTY